MKEADEFSIQEIRNLNHNNTLTIDMKKTCQIFQQHFSVCKKDDYFDNYLVVVEIIDEVPRHAYVVPMGAYKYWDEDLPFTFTIIIRNLQN